MLLSPGTKIYLVASYSDGPIAAYTTEEAAKKGRKISDEANFYLLEDTYVEAVALIE